MLRPLPLNLTFQKPYFSALILYCAVNTYLTYLYRKCTLKSTDKLVNDRADTTLEIAIYW